MRRLSLTALAAGTLATGVSLTAPAAMAAAPAQPAPMRMNTNISEGDILKAQSTWCSALLAISKAYREGGLSKARASANQVLDQAYAYRYGAVAFKPTLTSGAQTFRPTKDGALAYFVGADPRYPQDKGFALKPWTRCSVSNQVLQTHGMLGLSMGNVHLTDSSGKITSVDKTWVFIKEPDGSIRILLHHSSLPYQPPAATKP
ncbi:MAG: hypothetical protein RLZZ611_1025 [Cyanobacteriota bacterium]|jgi:hypothetical protein